MENIYKLTGKYAEYNDKYEQLSAALDEMFEENGGEETEVTEEMQSCIDQLSEMRAGVVQEIVENADNYAEIAVNKAAQRKVLEAEMKAVKEEQAKVLARYQARINRLQKSEDWWKENFAAAMQIAGVEKIGGGKTNSKFSIFWKKATSVEVDQDVVLAPFQDAVEELKAGLPAWASVEVKVNKAVLKKEATLPEGAELVENRTLQIR